jgi:hypothetical protein
MWLSVAAGLSRRIRDGSGIPVIGVMAAEVTGGIPVIGAIVNYGDRSKLLVEPGSDAGL